MAQLWIVRRHLDYARHNQNVCWSLLHNLGIHRLSVSFWTARSHTHVGLKACLLISAVIAALAGVADALVFNHRVDAYISPALLRQLRTDFEGVTIGLLIALLLSGQLSKKKPPSQ